MTETETAHSTITKEVHATTDLKPVTTKTVTKRCPSSRNSMHFVMLSSSTIKMINSNWRDYVHRLVKIIWRNLQNNVIKSLQELGIKHQTIEESIENPPRHCGCWIKCIILWNTRGDLRSDYIDTPDYIMHFRARPHLISIKWGSICWSVGNGIGWKYIPYV